MEKSPVVSHSIFSAVVNERDKLKKKLEECEETIKDLKDELQLKKNTIQGIIILLGGRQIGASTSILETTTYGYGKLDEYGFWEFPVPEIVVNHVEKLKEKHNE